VVHGYAIVAAQSNFRESDNYTSERFRRQLSFGAFDQFAATLPCPVQLSIVCEKTGGIYRPTVGSVEQPTETVWYIE